MSTERSERMTETQYREIIDDINNRLGDVEAYTKIIVGTLNTVTKERDQIRTDLATATERLRVAEEGLELCEKYDQTIQYDYGQVDRRGIMPPGGKRWKTPREIARDTLSRLREGGEG